MSEDIGNCGIAKNFQNSEIECEVPESFRNRKVDYLKITEVAKNKIAEVINNRQKPSSGIKISIRTKGCSGLSYNIEFADYGVNMIDQDEMIELDNGVRIFIDIKASLFVIGTTLDYQIDKFKEGFEFVNPNEKGRCGCGTSFFV